MRKVLSIIIAILILSLLTVGTIYLVKHKEQIFRTEYQVTFDVDGEITQQKVKLGEVIKEFPPTEKENYIFKGWSKDKKNIIDLTDYIIVKNEVFYAMYDRVPSPIADFEIENGVIYGYLGHDKEVVIPSSYSLDEEGHVIEGNKIQITGIGCSASSGTKKVSVFRFNQIIEKVFFPNTITKIYDYLFESCIFLKEVYLNEGLTELSNSLFRNCINLEKVNIPLTIEKIGSGVFEGCSSLKEMDLQNNESLISLGGYIFQGCYNLQSVYFPESLIDFRSCSSLFNNCYHLKNVKISSKATAFGSSMFYNCYNLEGNIVIPKTLYSFGSGCFIQAGINGNGFTIEFEEGSTLSGSFDLTIFYESKVKAIKNIPSNITQFKSNSNKLDYLELITFAENSQLQSLDKAMFTKLEQLTIKFTSPTPPSLTGDFTTIKEIIVPEEYYEAYKSAWPTLEEKITYEGKSIEE